MSVAADWKALYELPTSELKGKVFAILADASELIQIRLSDDPELLSVVPRLADLLAAKPELAGFREVFSTLARSVGLWNYVDRRGASARDELAAELATVPQLGITLHREQLSALDTLLSGKNLILSAPTSFGKSILIDVLLLHDRFRRVAIVLPTIALLDEFRRRLLSRFGDRFDILMHHLRGLQKTPLFFLGRKRD